MTNTVLIKRSSTANAVPLAGNLQSGELAINYNDGNLFYKNTSNVVTVLASNKFASVSGNVTGGNILTDGMVTATGNVTGGNILTSGLVSATSTITSAANITGGNVLTGGLVSATGNVTGGNISTGGLITAIGNVTGGNLKTSGLVSATGAITSAANITGANILTSGTLSAAGVTSSGVINLVGTSNVSLGSVANLHISGGTANYILSTDGSGTLSWAAPSASIITVDDFTGNGVQTEFTLSVTPYDINNTSVNYDGVVQLRTGYSLSGANVVFSTPPADGSHIEVTTISVALAGDAAASGSNTQVQFNNSGNLGGSSLFTFNNVTSNLGVPNLNVSGNIMPTSNNAYSIGSPDLVFKHVYIGAGSLYVDGTKVLGSSANTIVVSADVNQTVRVTTSGTGDVELLPAGTGAIAAKGPLQIQTGKSILSSDGNAVQFASPIGVDSIASHTANTDITLSALGTGHVKIDDDLVVTGNLTVQGTGGNLSVTNLTVEDNIIDISAETTGTPTQNAGLRVIRGDEPSTSLRWYESGDAWQFTNDGSTYLTMVGKDSAGNVTVGNISTTGNVTSAYFIGNGSQLTGLPASYANSNVAAYLASGTDSTNIITTANVTGGNITTSGLISSTGNITGGNLSGTNITGTLTTASQTNITAVGTLTSLNSGAISSSGNITGGNILTGGIISASGNINSNNINATNWVTGANISAGGNTFVGGYLSVVGNLYVANIVSSSNLVVQDPLVYLTANSTYPYNYDIGMYSQFTGGAGNTYQHTGFVRDYTDNTWKLFSNVPEPTGTAIDFTNAIYDPIKTGAITATSGSFSSTVSATGNITGGNVLTGGLVSATSTITSAANITGANINTAGVASAASFIGSVVSVTANITGANILTGGLISATSTITGGNLTTGGSLTLSGGTASSVVYLNGSKVATTSSALSFDGTRLRATGSIVSNNYYIQTDGGVQASASMVAQGALQSYSGAGIFMSYESTYGRIESYDYTGAAWKNIAIAPNGGNVGVGTSSPGVKFDVTTSTAGFYAARIFNTSATGYGLKIKNGNDSNDALRISNAADNADNIAMYGNGSAYFQGNVGVGTSTPSSKLEVSIAASTSGTIAKFTSPSYDSVYVAAGSSSNSCGIGTVSTSAFNIFVNSSSRVMVDTNGYLLSGYTSSQGSYRTQVNGNLYVGGTITEASSIALKENLQPIQGALDTVTKLKGWIYDRKDGSAKHEPGLIAEEVLEVLPDVVSGDAQGVKYTKLIAYLVESIKELKSEIDILKGR